MAFEALLGNRQLKDNLIQSLRKGRSSHFYLISGPAGSGKHTLARLLAAALLCRHSDRPCLECSACRKVMAGLHPDCITVEDPEHKTVPVKLVRHFREDAFIRPNEAEKKIYIFPQELGIEGQNALLKLLEEPPAYGVFLLLTDNPEKLLPTVRSRCVELKLLPLSDAILRRELEKQFPQAQADSISAAMARSGGFLGQAQALLRDGEAIPPQTAALAEAYANRNALLLTRTLVPMEKWKREQLVEILQQWQALFESALACRSGIQALSPLASALAAARSGQDLNRAIHHLQKATAYALSNVSPAAICGYLVWALR